MLDTVRAVAWSTTDTALVSVASDPSGRGLFSEVGPRTVGVRANGGAHGVWACPNGRLCREVGHIEVSPPGAGG